jgi:hypothetical protein
VDGKRVHPSREFAGQCLIDHAVTLEPALSFEGLRHDINPKMALPACPMSGMALVLMGFVNDPNALGRESLDQLSCDNLLHAHSLPLVAERPADCCGRTRKAVEITSYGSVKLAGNHVSSA